MTSHTLRNVACCVTAALALSAPPVLAQQRRVEMLYTYDGRRLDFGPDGVWRVRAREVAQQRARLLGQGQFSQLNAPIAPAAWNGSALTGVLYIPTILVGFKDTDTSKLRKPAEYDSIFYTTQALKNPQRTYSVRMFYEEMSHGLFSVQGRTYGWVLADSNRAYYLNACGAGTDPMNCPNGLSRLGQLLDGALAKVEASVDFSQYDNNGPDGIPNSADDDGVVDLVQFVQPVVGQECRGPGYGAHHYVISGLTGSVYTTSDPSTKGGDVKVNEYQIVSGVGGVGCTDSTTIMAIGTSAHETGHGLGLPDLYDTGLNSTITTEGIGEWGLMGSGNYTSLNSPAHFDAWSLQQMGWVTVVPLADTATVRLGAVELSDTVYYVRPLAPNPRGEYFLLENKQSQLADTANMTTFSKKVGGLLVWHVDSTKIAQHGINTDNSINSGFPHGLELVQADGMGQLDKAAGSGGNRGDAGDPYPGTSLNVRYSYNTNPKAVMNNDTTVFAGFELDSVTQVVPKGQMVFKISFGGLTIVRASDTTAQVSVDGVKYHRFVQQLTPGTVYTVAIDSAQLSSDSLRQFVFQSWSNGRPIQQTDTAKVTGDSISAAVSTRFRVRATASAGGTVSSFPPHSSDTLAAGYYALKDTTFSLKAAPAGGKLFFGWSGDTTAAGDSLALTVSRAYTVTASFGDSPVAADVVSQILGTRSVLTADQLKYLDHLGNNNSGFDVGDFLAWVNATGSQAAPEVAAALAHLGPAASAPPAAPRRGKGRRP